MSRPSPKSFRDGGHHSRSRRAEWFPGLSLKRASVKPLHILPAMRLHGTAGPVNAT